MARVQRLLSLLEARCSPILTMKSGMTHPNIYWLILLTRFHTSAIRNAAALTTSSLLVNVIQSDSKAAAAAGDIVSKLVTVGISDPGM